MEVRFIQAAETHPLRLQVLRPGGAPADAVFPNDEREGTFHLGAFENGQLLGIGSFYPERHRSFKGPKQFRLRGMATSPDHRGRGIGAKLLLHGLEHLHAQGTEVIWCNARVKAAPFYARLHFTTEGEIFELPGIGMHYLMHRKVQLASAH